MKFQRKSFSFSLENELSKNVFVRFFLNILVWFLSLSERD